MAMFDDCAFLVNHIRNSFITSDETGMCELILDTDDYPINNQMSPVETPVGSSESNEDPNSRSISLLGPDKELSRSCDIVFDMELTGHRRRSNTAQRLEKLKRDKQKQSQIKHVQWRATYPTVEDVDDMFTKKDVVPRLAPTQRKSAFSLKLEEFEMAATNPFMEYAKFDGQAAGGLPTKTIDIYLTMATASDRSFPMTVVTLSSAKVHQLIGLICWQYTTENREPVLSETSVNAYSLNMVEDDGEVDGDFPPLDSREPISKFGFNKLALVVKSVALHRIGKQTTDVIIHTADGSKYTISVQQENTLLRDVLNEVIERRKLQVKTGQSYRLEKLNSPGVPVDLDAFLSSTGVTQFCLIRENSAWPVNTGSNQLLGTSSDVMCHQYRSYNVSMLHKLRPKNAAQLGVSGDKIELDPAADRGSDSTGSYFTRRSILFPKQKSKTIAIDDVAACFVRDEHTAADRTVVRLIYSCAGRIGFKRCDMECPVRVALDIVSQIVNILHYRPTSASKSYASQKEPRVLLTRRHTTVLS